MRTPAFCEGAIAAIEGELPTNPYHGTPQAADWAAGYRYGEEELGTFDDGYEEGYRKGYSAGKEADDDDDDDDLTLTPPMQSRAS